VTLPRRPRFSRWRRLPGIFRTGDRRPIDSGTELDRLILYVPARILDLAEELAERAGAPTVQDYCALLLMHALENERVQQKVSDFEARRGPLEGLKQIADDPAYLVEWQEQSEARPEGGPRRDRDAGTAGPVRDEALLIELPAPVPEGFADATGVEAENEYPVFRTPESAVDEPSPPGAADPPVVSIITLNPTVRPMSEQNAIEIIARHVGAGDDDWGFLPCLRRGEGVSMGKVAELTKALGQLEDELQGSPVIDRRAAHALHRLALESQVLLTDAWPGAFDERVVAAIRTVQEAVERILSGQDIRYYPTPTAPASEQAL
jgi:hypothetical protein